MSFLDKIQFFSEENSGIFSNFFDFSSLFRYKKLGLRLDVQFWEVVV
jgi:hypothetical protein